MAYKIDDLTLHRIATYVFVEACEESQSGNHYVDTHELERIFGVVMTKHYYEVICDIIRNDFKLQVLDLNEGNDEYYFNEREFNITIGGYYTIYGDTDYDVEEEEE